MTKSDKHIEIVDNYVAHFDILLLLLDIAVRYSAFGKIVHGQHFVQAAI